jgi:hypothetical protein
MYILNLAPYLVMADASTELKIDGMMPHSLSCIKLFASSALPPFGSFTLELGLRLGFEWHELYFNQTQKCLSFENGGLRGGRGGL